MRSQESTKYERSWSGGDVWFGLVAVAVTVTAVVLAIYLVGSGP